MAPFSLTEALVASDSSAYQRATQSSFLKLAAQGRLSKRVLGTWLANDRIYIHGYIRGIGKLIGFLERPGAVTSRGQPDPVSTRLLDWMIDALVNIRREERFFVDTAMQYGIEVDLPRGGAADGANVAEEAKLEGLRRFEKLFLGVEPNSSSSSSLPWLEAAVVFWGTEKCYVDAWTWAKEQLDEGKDGKTDEDGGALRSEFIPNWTGKEFVQFVERLGGLIDEAVRDVVAQEGGGGGDGAREELMRRAKGKWEALLGAEEAFWPVVE
jgi:thiaminase